MEGEGKQGETRVTYSRALLRERVTRLCRLFRTARYPARFPGGLLLVFAFPRRAAHVCADVGSLQRSRGAAGPKQEGASVCV